MKGVQIDLSFLQKQESKHEAQHIAEQIVELENETVENKQKLIEDLGTVFEMDGINPLEISSCLTRSIGDFVAPSWIRKICHKHKWTRPYDSDDDDDDKSNDGNAPRGDSDTSDSSNSSKDEQDKPKKKNFFMSCAKFTERVDENGVIDPKQIPYYAYRYPYWTFFNSVIELLKKFREEIEKDYDVEVSEDGDTVKKLQRDYSQLFETKKDQEEFTKALMDLYFKIADNAQRAVDNRQSILATMYIPFIAKLSTATIKHFSDKHFSKIRQNLYDITTKRVTQYIHDVNSFSDLVEAVEEDSWKWHYLDMRCPKCKVFLLKRRSTDDGKWFWVCDNWKAHNSEVTFEASILRHKLNQLEMNRGKAADAYQQQRNIPD